MSNHNSHLRHHPNQLFEQHPLKHQHQQQQHRNLIINGVKAPVHRFPYFVLLNGGDCGGSLIAPDIVLTAGHCYPKRTLEKNYTHDLAWARVGIISREEPDEYSTTTTPSPLQPLQHHDFVVRRSMRHKKFRRYGDDEFSYDYTILQLDGTSPLPYVPLLRDDSILQQQPHAQLTAVGLGWTIPDEPSKANWLHQVNLTMITNEECDDVSDYNIGGDESYHGRIDSSHLCTFEPGKDSCAYDSGSPLILTTNLNNHEENYQDYLVAQVSWGMECADEIFPAVNARLSTVLDWIDETVCQWSVDPPPDFNCHPSTSSTTPTEDQTSWHWLPSFHKMGATTTTSSTTATTDFIYILVACCLATVMSNLYWRRRRHDYEALK